MANEEHLKRLREAIAARNIAAWTKWREESHIIPLLGGRTSPGRTSRMRISGKRTSGKRSSLKQI